LEEKFVKSPFIAINPTVNPSIYPLSYIVAIERHSAIKFSLEYAGHELGKLMKSSLLAYHALVRASNLLFAMVEVAVRTERWPRLDCFTITDCFGSHSHLPFLALTANSDC
jgi:hypothetical protein